MITVMKCRHCHHKTSPKTESNGKIKRVMLNIMARDGALVVMMRGDGTMEEGVMTVLLGATVGELVMVPGDGTLARLEEGVLMTVLLGEEGQEEDNEGVDVVTKGDGE